MRHVVSSLAATIALALLTLSAVGSANEPEADDPCDGSSTPEINKCFGDQLEIANASMGRYFQAAIDRYLRSGEDAVVLGLRDSQRAFEAYRDIECGAVYERWKTGTIRGLMELTCSIRLTDQRTHAIWRNWLTFPDGSPPTLREPVPTESARP